MGIEKERAVDADVRESGKQVLLKVTWTEIYRFMYYTCIYMSPMYLRK